MSEFAKIALEGSVAPLLAALIVAGVLWRTRYPWFAIVAGYATTIALSTGFSFTPLSAGRKVVLVTLLAPFVGAALDSLPAKHRGTQILVAISAALVSLWVFGSVFVQREGLALWLAVIGIALFVAALTHLVSRLRDDGTRSAAAGVGLGVGVGVSAVLSASVGYLSAGGSIAAGAGAILLVQALTGRDRPAGWLGALAIGISCALFAAATLLLAELPWYAMALLLPIPLVAALPIGERLAPVPRAAVLVGCALLAAMLPILAAWAATRAG